MHVWVLLASWRSSRGGASSDNTAPAPSLTCGAGEPDQVDATWLSLLICFFCLTEQPSGIKWKGIYKSLIQGRLWRTVFQNNECRAGLPGFTEQPHPLTCSLGRWSAELPLFQHPPLENEGKFFLRVLLWGWEGCPRVTLVVHCRVYSSQEIVAVTVFMSLHCFSFSQSALINVSSFDHTSRIGFNSVFTRWHSKGMCLKW